MFIWERRALQLFDSFRHQRDVSLATLRPCSIIIKTRATAAVHTPRQLRPAFLRHLIQIKKDTRIQSRARFQARTGWTRSSCLARINQYYWSRARKWSCTLLIPVDQALTYQREPFFYLCTLAKVNLNLVVRGTRTVLTTLGQTSRAVHLGVLFDDSLVGDTR